MTFNVNGEQSRLGRMAVNGMFGVLGAAYLILMLPARLLGIGQFWKDVDAEARRVWLTDARHSHRVSYETVDETPSTAMTGALEAEVFGLVAAQDWAGLCLRIETLVRTQAACPSQRRLVHVALWAAIEALEGPDTRANVCAPMAQARIGEDVVPQVIDASLGSLGGCVLAARILLSQCWDLRGQDYVDAVPDENWVRIAAKMEEAMGFLGVADAGPTNIVPLTQLRFLPFMGDLDGALMDWFAQAVKADPADTMPGEFLGNFLLPRWGVAYEELETIARQTAAWTEHKMGMAAYAVIYNAALKVEADPAYNMDFELYCEGVQDLAKLQGYSADQLPGLCQKMLAISQIPAHQNMDAQARETWEENTRKVYLLGLSLLEDHLGEIHPESWNAGLEGALNMISLAMGQELEEGKNLIVGPQGIQAYIPEAKAA